MSYQKPKKLPQFADLKGILAQTQLDSATYQTIEGLIDRLTQFQNTIVGEIEGLLKGGSSVKPHANTHKVNGTDPVDVTQLAGFTNDPSLFLRADRTFAAPPTGGMPDPHASTHRPGGSDSLVNNAWTDQAQTFTQLQTFNQNIKTLGFIYEAGRTTFMGQRSSWTPTIYDNSGNLLSNGGTACFFSLIGNMVFFKFHIVNIVLPVNAWYVRVTIPFPVIDPDVTYNTWRYSTGGVGFSELGYFYVSSNGLHLWRNGASSIEIPASTITAQGQGFYFLG